MVEDRARRLTAFAPRCAAFVEVTRDLLEWEWDHRFQVMLAVFESSSSERMRAALEDVFEETWFHHNLDNAPPRIQTLARAFGGVRAGQGFHATDPASTAMLFCAWWPWGNGQRVSIRVGYTIRDRALEERFKAWFLG